MDAWSGGGSGGAASSPTKVIVNATSNNSTITLAAAATSAGGVLALTGGVLTMALSVTGAGEASVIAYRQTDASARTLQLKITVDGVNVPYNSTAVTTAVANRALVGTAAGLPLIRFSTSLLVEVLSSTTDSLTAIEYAYTRTT